MQYVGLACRAVARAKVANAGNHAIARLRCLRPHALVVNLSARHARLYARRLAHPYFHPNASLFAHPHVSRCAHPLASRYVAPGLHAAKVIKPRHQDPQHRMLFVAGGNPTDAFRSASV
jgi:hypothetical protein